MKRITLMFLTVTFLSIALIAQAVEIKVKPERLNPNGKRARMKVVILDVEDTSAINTSSITLNGLAPIKTKVNPKKVTAFFSKSDVVASLGDVQKGQTATLQLSFSVGNAPAQTLTDDVKIVGKKKSKPVQPNVPASPNANSNRP
jgi:hypothetical protein